MQPTLSITADWERLDEGPPEERACFAAVAILCNDQSLTEGRDGFVNRIRPGPLVSAYHLAEWLAWNWWRLRWEPRSNAPDWPFAHRLTTIGEGYVWPNITIFSDGERTALIAKPTTARPATAFRYISDYAAIVPSLVFEGAVDRFIGQVLGQLQAEHIHGTNLDRLWSELTDERRDIETARRRKLEALLGQDPDTADPVVIDRLLTDAQELGERAVEELAADSPQGGTLLTVDDLRQIAKQSGFSTSPRDTARLSADTMLPSPKEAPAWRLGVEAARALRVQAGLGSEPVEDGRLADLAAIRPLDLADNSSSRNIFIVPFGIAARLLGSVDWLRRQGKPEAGVSFALDQSETESSIFLRSHWRSGRRFELARLLADRIVLPVPGTLHVATRASTYRQKMQRAFAAELLCPFDAMDAMLGGDYSTEAQEDAASYFGVSEWVVRRQLVNHRRLAQEDLDEDIETAA